MYVKSSKYVCTILTSGSGVYKLCMQSSLNMDAVHILMDLVYIIYVCEIPILWVYYQYSSRVIKDLIKIRRKF